MQIILKLVLRHKAGNVDFEQSKGRCYLIQRIIRIYISEVKALTYGSQTLSERIMPIIKDRNDLGTPQTLG